jgi:glycosyltransferase involved in cell wall biosynthesis
MRILHVIADLDPEKGGVCQALRTMIAGLEKSDIQSEVVSMVPSDAHFLRNDSFTVHAMGEGIGPWCYNPRLVPWLLNNFSRFDILIIHGLWLFQGYAVKKAMRIYKKEKITDTNTKKILPELFVMPHGMLDPYFQRATGRRMKSIRNWLYWKLTEGRLCNGADGMLFTCEAERLLAREPFRPYHPRKETVIGLNVEEPIPRTDFVSSAFTDRYPAAGTGYLLYLGRIHEKKGVDLLIMAYAFITDKYKRLNIPIPKLVIAGPGLESAYGQKIQKLVADRPQIGERVIFPGMLTGNAKWGAIYGCEAFVLNSHQENFGISIVEAMACCKPVLISKQVNIWKEIENEKAGLVSTDTLTGTMDLLDRWISMPHKEKNQTGKRARSCFEQYFSTGPAVDRLLNAFLKNE